MLALLRELSSGVVKQGPASLSTPTQDPVTTACLHGAGDKGQGPRASLG